MPAAGRQTAVDRAQQRGFVGVLVSFAHTISVILNG